MLNCEVFEVRCDLGSVGLAFELEFLVEELGLDLGLLPQPLRNWLERCRQSFRMDDLPFFRPGMHQAVIDLLETPFSGKLRCRHDDALALELSCLIGQRSSA